MIHSKRRKNLGRNKRSNRRSNISRMRGGARSMLLTFGGDDKQIKLIMNDIGNNTNMMQVHIGHIFLVPYQFFKDNTHYGWVSERANLDIWSDKQKRNHYTAIRNLQRSIKNYDIPSFTLIHGFNFYTPNPTNTESSIEYTQLEGDIEDYDVTKDW
jgi:hypothetical protein